MILHDSANTDLAFRMLHFKISFKSQMETKKSSLQIEDKIHRLLTFYQTFSLRSNTKLFPESKTMYNE